MTSDACLSRVSVKAVCGQSGTARLPADSGITLGQSHKYAVPPVCGLLLLVAHRPVVSHVGLSGSRGEEQSYLIQRSEVKQCVKNNLVSADAVCSFHA